MRSFFQNPSEMSVSALVEVDSIALRIASVPSNLASDGTWDATNEVLEWMNDSRLLSALSRAQVGADTIGATSLAMTEAGIWEVGGTGRWSISLPNRDLTKRGSPVSRAAQPLALYRRLMQTIVNRAERGGTIVCYEQGLIDRLEKLDAPEEYLAEASQALRSGLDRTGIIYTDSSRKIEVISDSSTGFLAEAFDRARRYLLGETDLTELKLFNTTERSKGLAGIDEEENTMLLSLCLKVARIWERVISVSYALNQLESESIAGKIIDPMDYRLDLDLPIVSFIPPSYLQD